MGIRFTHHTPIGCGEAYNRAAMEIDTEQLKKAIIDMFQSLRALETELFVYRFAIHLATTTGAAPHVPWDATLAAARQNPMLETIMSQKYDPIVADLLQSIDKADLQARVSELLRQWKPTTPPN